ncbi:MAG: hypothetical protein M1825_001680 [Sarcosagium campestre]|nr:MAG: hypothetical protein M1825_001680 [Sarcosagium campestre]
MGLNGIVDQPEHGVEASSSSSNSQSVNEPTIASNDDIAHIINREVNENGSIQSQSVQGPNSHRLQSFIPEPLRRVTAAVVAWAKGPKPPRIHKINGFFPRLQSAPIRLLDKYLPKRRHQFILLLAFYFCWLLIFVTVLHHSAFANDIEGFGTPVRLSCVDSYWYVISAPDCLSWRDMSNFFVRASGNGCGLDGNLCRPFDNSSLAFRCPANCVGVQVLNPHAVGTEEVVYRELVIGGPSEGGKGLAQDQIYRGDSFVCGSAIHAGIISNKVGGCGVVKLVGKGNRYPSTERNGIRSVGFDSSFPLSYSFDATQRADCKDLRWPLFAVSLLFTCLASLFIVSPAIFFPTVFVGVYFHVGLASDPPSYSSYYAIVSILIGRFLPAAFVAFVLFRYCIHRTLLGLTAQVEKTILWLGGCWVGALTNYTFDFIPISRLTPHDLNQQPGAKAALSIIIICILIIVVGQILYLRIEGRLPRFLALYLTFCICLALFAAIPNLNLRIHHYILGILLIPGTSMQTRPSLLYQGILIGFFINGIARWGFDSILQTPAELLGDGQLESPLPLINTPVITATNITFAWSQPSTSSNENGTYDGMSVLVNDVERYIGYQNYDPQEFTWERGEDEKERQYFRFAYMQGSSPGDYTKAGTWEIDGNWTEMDSGPS